MAIVRVDILGNLTTKISVDIFNLVFLLNIQYHCCYLRQRCMKFRWIFSLSISINFIWSVKLFCLHILLHEDLRILWTFPNCCIVSACSYGVLRYLSLIAILTTTRDQTHAPCASPKTHPLDHSHTAFLIVYHTCLYN